MEAKEKKQDDVITKENCKNEMKQEISKLLRESEARRKVQKREHKIIESGSAK